MTALRKLPPWLVVLLPFLAAGLVKVWLVAAGRVPFNSDEAVVALMARHILQGERPAFFYGQAYMGSLDAFLVAAGFALFGQQVWVIRLVQGLLYLGTLATTLWLGVEVFGSRRAGLLAVWLLAVPTVNVTLYTTASLGGYGEALLVGNGILILALRIGKKLAGGFTAACIPPLLALGFLIGLGVWAFGLTLVYSLPAVLYVFWRALAARQGAALTRTVLRPGLWGAAGVLLGSAPWWSYSLTHGFSGLLSELGGGAIAGVEGLPWLAQAGRHLTSLLLLGSTVAAGLRPPWNTTWLALPLLPFVLMFWLVTGLHLIHRLRSRTPGWEGLLLVAGVAASVCLAFVFTPFGADPSGRYFVPLAVPLGLFAAVFILDLREKAGFWAYGLAGLVLVFQLAGTVQSALRFPPGITTQFYEPAQIDHRHDQALIDFLREQGETRGYTNYWVSYPLAFLSQEELIFVPRLPYHPDFRYTERDDRYVPYGQEVAKAAKVAYITTNHPDLDEYLRREFAARDVSFQEARIGEFQVFYRLSRPVRPAEIGLGITGDGPPARPE